MPEKITPPFFTSKRLLWYLDMQDNKFWLDDGYIIPTDPAVNPTARKKTNSSKSLGNEFTIKLSWVIWPCAPQV